jgi:hypothetical protein
MGELSGAPGAAGGEGDGEAEGSRRSGPALGQDSRPGGIGILTRTLPDTLLVA